MMRVLIDNNLISLRVFINNKFTGQVFIDDLYILDHE